MAIVARKDFPASNFKEFITYLSANNDKMTYGFAGIGSASHLCSLLFFHAINTTVNGAPYKGTAPALNDLLGGHLDFMCDQTINVLQPAKSGLVKAFAATTPQRLKVAPDLPTIAESGLPDFQMVGLVRNVCAERDAKAGHRQAFGCTAEGSAGSGGAGTAGAVGRRDRAARAGEAGRSARSSQGRNRQVGADHQESGRIGAVAFRNRAAEVG
jgi:Tripartite tricarboxylate transporter family receptor